MANSHIAHRARELLRRGHHRARLNRALSAEGEGCLLVALGVSKALLGLVVADRRVYARPRLGLPNSR
jgi:hypothetical protein